MDLSVGGAEPLESPLRLIEPLAGLDLLAGGLLVGVQVTLGCEVGGGFSFPLDRAGRSGVSIHARGPIGFSASLFFAFVVIGAALAGSCWPKMHRCPLHST